MSTRGIIKEMSMANCGSLESLTSLSAEKFTEQCWHMVHHKLPGLHNGYSSQDITSTNGTRGEGFDSRNASMQLLSAPAFHGSNNNENIMEVKIRLFYAGRPFPVRLLYSARQPWMPPDILCDDVDFNDAITLYMLSNQLSSLERWQEGKLQSVADLLSELHSLYHKYRVARVEDNNPVLREQYEEFIKELQLSETDVEVYSAQGENVLCVRLPIEFDDLPAPLFSEDCGTARCVLELTATGNLNSYEPSLSLSARAESLLCGDSGDMLRLPPIPPNCTSLVAYASSVIQIINDNIKRILHAYEIRKQIIAALLCKYDAAISQYDKVRFKSVQLLLNEDGFHYIVDIIFPHGFPHHCSARVHLRSISQTEDEQPSSALVPNMSHAGETDPDELLSLIMQAASSFAPIFKRQYGRGLL